MKYYFINIIMIVCLLKTRKITFVLIFLILLFNTSIVIILNSSFIIDIRYSEIESIETESGSLSIFGNSLLLQTDISLLLYDHNLQISESQEIPDMVIPAVINTNSVIATVLLNSQTLSFQIYNKQLDLINSKDVKLSRDLQDYKYQDIILAYIESQLIEVNSHSLFYSYDVGEEFNNSQNQVHIIYEDKEYTVGIPVIAISNISQYVQANQYVFSEYVIHDGYLYYVSAIYTQNYTNELEKKLYLNAVDIISGTNTSTLLYFSNATLTKFTLREFKLQGENFLLSYEIADEGLIRQSSIDLKGLDIINTDFTCFESCSDDILFYNELIGIKYTILDEGSTMELIKSDHSIKLYSPKVYFNQRWEKVALPHILSTYALDQNNLLTVSSINTGEEKHTIALMQFTFADDIQVSMHEVGQLDIIDLYDLQVINGYLFAYLTYDRDTQIYQVHALSLKLSNSNIPRNLFIWTNGIVALIVLTEYFHRKYTS